MEPVALLPERKTAPDPGLGVLLLNLGGPEKLEDVRPFLYNLFSDPDIIRIRSSALRKLLAWLIATTRQGKSRRLYRQIGGGSPLRRITEGQAAALQARLAAQDRPARVYVGMRCWKPTIGEAMERIRRDGIRRLVVLPLFPQYSVTTTGSCFNCLRPLSLRRETSPAIELLHVNEWYREPLYLESMADLIGRAQERLSGADPKNTHLLYSAHSIPERYVTEGDPYLTQTQQTVKLIDSLLGSRFPSTLAFQSKIGPVKWLGPPTGKVIAELAGQGVRKLLLAPVSFVSDHIETLQEIDIVYRELALAAGIKQFERAESLNLYPKFIDALSAIVIKRLRENPPASHPGANLRAAF